MGKVASKGLFAALACALVSACTAPSPLAPPPPGAVELMVNQARIGTMQSWTLGVVADRPLPERVLSACYGGYASMVRGLPSAWTTEDQALMDTNASEAKANECAEARGYRHARVRVMPTDRPSVTGGVTFEDYERSLAGLDRRGELLMGNLASVRGPVEAQGWADAGYFEDSRHGGRWGCGVVRGHSVMRLANGRCSGWRSTHGSIHRR